jgi:hypothetical protein
MTRRQDACGNCGVERDIVSNGLCAKCYMRERRDQPAWLAGPDRSQNKAQRELNRRRVAFSKMLALLDEAAISKAAMQTTDYEAIKSILIAAIDRINTMQKS